MYRFELLPHTADVAVKAIGSTRAELMSAALVGMFAAAEPVVQKNAKSVRRHFQVTSSDLPSLLVDLLNEAIANSDTFHETYEAIEFEELSDTSARGTFIGKPVQSFATQIKAATHYNLNIQRKNDHWEAVIIFDA